MLAHLFLDPERAEGADPKLEDEYFNIVWAKNYPQIMPLKPKDGHKFDLGQAWIDERRHASPPAPRPTSPGSPTPLRPTVSSTSTGSRRHAAPRHAGHPLSEPGFLPAAGDLQVVRRIRKIPDQDIVVYIAENGLETIRFGHHTLRPAHNGTALINYSRSVRNVCALFHVGRNEPAPLRQMPSRTRSSS